MSLNYNKPEITIQRAALSPDEAVAYLGISRMGVYRLLKAGKLPRVKVGCRTLIPVKALDAFLDQAA